ncbi:MAG: amidohydrolase family protein, partial [Cyclobacteriaceae bacterium]
MKRLQLIIVLLTTMLGCTNNDKVDLLLTNGKIWTGDESNPWVTWLAVKDEHIFALGKDDQPFEGEATQTIDLKNRLMLPGFNDSHVHFASAGHLLLNINLLDVNSSDRFIENVKQTADRLPRGSWITRGDWGAYEAWSMGSTGGKNAPKFSPHRSMIDSITTQHPVLVTRYDRKVGLANNLALDFLGIDSEDGVLEGSLLDDALSRIPEKSFDQLLAESKRAMEECRKWGVTTVQDMSPPDQLDVYNKLKEEGELTCRINFSPSRLIEYQDMKDKGWVIDWSDKNNPGTAGNDWISFGTIKTHIDGIMGGRTARFYQPYSDNDMENRFWRGGWREFSKDMPSFKSMLIKADEANIQLRIHAIGDEANAILIDILDTL